MSGWANSTRRSRLPADWDKRRRAVRARAGERCEHVDAHGRCAADGAECDHIQRGDDHSLSNLQWLCSTHHREKTVAERTGSRRRPPEPHPGLRS